MGKVGSTAIVNSLSNLSSDIYHVHSLVPAKLNKTCRVLMDKKLGIPHHVKQSMHLIDHVLHRDSPIKIITPIRNPLERNMSAFFQELSTEVIIDDSLRKGLAISSWIKVIGFLPIPNEWKNYIIQHTSFRTLHKNLACLIEHFKSSYRHRIPLDWMDDELKQALHIDVYDHDFGEAGFQIYRNKNVELLILRSELSNTIKTQVIEQFLNKKIQPIKSDHLSNKKLYGKAFDSFKSQIEFDEDFLKVFRDSKYFNHFYLNKY